MSRVLAALLVGILLLVYCTSCSSGPVANKVQKLKARFANRSNVSDPQTALDKSDATKDGMSIQESLGVVRKLGGIFDKEDVASPDFPYAPGVGDQYDPIQMGALKQTEIDAHKRGLAEMAPFQSYGPSMKVVRDDNDWLRATGVPFVGGMPRSLKKIPSGPQAMARQVPSTSEKDIYTTHLISASEPCWG